MTITTTVESTRPRSTLRQERRLRDDLIAAIDTAAQELEQYMGDDPHVERAEDAVRAGQQAVALADALYWGDFLASAVGEWIAAAHCADADYDPIVGPVISALETWRCFSAEQQR